MRTDCSYIPDQHYALETLALTLYTECRERPSWRAVEETTVTHLAERLASHEELQAFLNEQLAEHLESEDGIATVYRSLLRSDPNYPLQNDAFLTSADMPRPGSFLSWGAGWAASLLRKHHAAV